MPTRPPSVCPRADCPNVTPCPEHQRRPWSTGRSTVDQRRARYPKNWRKIRAAQLRAQPWCHQCGALATDVDHRTALAAGGPNDTSNLQSLCHPCHARKTAHEGVAARQ